MLDGRCLPKDRIGQRASTSMSEQNEHGDELVGGNTYVVTFGDYGVGGSFTGVFIGWFRNADINKPPDMAQPPEAVPLGTNSSLDWWAVFDTGYVSGDRWTAERINSEPREHDECVHDAIVRMFKL